MGQQRGKNNGVVGIINVPNSGATVGASTGQLFTISVTDWKLKPSCTVIDSTGRGGTDATINGVSSANNETAVNGNEKATFEFIGHLPTIPGGSSILQPFVSARSMITLTEQTGVDAQTFMALITSEIIDAKEGKDTWISGTGLKTGAFTGVTQPSLPASSVTNFLKSGIVKEYDQYGIVNNAKQSVLYDGIANTDAAENALLIADAANAIASPPVTGLKYRNSSIHSRPSDTRAIVRRNFDSNDDQDSIWNQGSETGEQDDTNHWTEVRQIPCDASETELQIYGRAWYGYFVSLTVGLGGAITAATVTSGGKGIVNGTYSWNVTDNNGASCTLSTTVTTGTITLVTFGATTGAFAFPPNANRAVLSYDPTYYANFPPAFKYQGGAIGIGVKKIQPLIAVVHYRYMFNNVPIKASGRLVERNVFARRVITNATTGASKVQVYCRRCIQYATGQWLAWLGREYQQETVIRYRLTINAVDTNFIINYSSNEGRMYSLEWGKLNNAAAFGQGTGTVRFVSGQPSGCDYVDEASGGFTKSSEMTYDFLYDPFRFFTLSGWAPFLPVSSNLGTGWVDASNFADLTATVADSSPGLCDFGNLFLIGNGNA